MMEHLDTCIGLVHVKTDDTGVTLTATDTIEQVFLPMCDWYHIVCLIEKLLHEADQCQTN